MPKFIAITAPTARWILNHSVYLDAISSELQRLCDTPSLVETVLAVGSLRAAHSKSGLLLAIWCTEYQSSAGEEPWGMIRCQGPMSILASDDVQREVLERCLFVIAQRHEGLNLPEQFIHRSHDDVHTCLAGRNVARTSSIAYFDGQVKLGHSSRQIVMCVGPFGGVQLNVGDALRPLVDSLRVELQQLPFLTRQADQLLVSAVQRPAAELAVFSKLRDRFRAVEQSDEVEPVVALIPALKGGMPSDACATSQSLKYDQWVADDGPLTEEQRAILNSDVLERQPLRIAGPAGSGKTLLMQLLAIKMLKKAESQNRPCKILYIVHNSAMLNTVWGRFVDLGLGDLIDSNGPCQLHVDTLFGYSRDRLGTEEVPVMDEDADETKRFQREIVNEALGDVLSESNPTEDDCPTLWHVAQDRNLIPMFAALVADEIGIAIKGHGLTGDPKRYIESEQSLSRLHGLLSPRERDIVFKVFQAYHNEVFEELGVLDTDDLAISLFARLRTPLWKMKRKQQGFDFVFVDETQLFNENERRLFPLLTRRDEGNLPIALALDEAQQLQGAVSSGFGLLGLSAIREQQLRTVYRSTPAILSLAFHLIQRTTDLFGVEFPDFTKKSVSLVPDGHKLASKPAIVTGGTSEGIGKFVLRHARRLRGQNLRQVGVVVHSERYWDDVVNAFKGYPHFPLSRRGEQIDREKPLVVLTRPSFVGGQEFDAVVAVGLEEGLVPPQIGGLDGLRAALEQQALREMYLTFTRARFRLVITKMIKATPSPLLLSAIKSGLLVEEK